MLLVDRIFFDSSSSPAGTGSGVAARQARSLPPFTGVELAGDNNVVVRVGVRQSVTVHADSNLLSRVTTRVRSGTLVIGTTPGNHIAVTAINSPKLTVALPGSGNVEATGTTTKLDVTISGDGTALLRRLIARDANAALRGDGSIMLTATHSLKATISGSGTVLYGGAPRHVTQRVTGSGTVSAG